MNDYKISEPSVEKTRVIFSNYLHEDTGTNNEEQNVLKKQSLFLDQIINQK